MASSDRKLELLQHILRLRRAGQESPGNEDIAAVRVALEQELGEVVSRRAAARLLGVSHTALERWIKTGDLPVIYSRQGRAEIPVPALLELAEQVSRDAKEGPTRYALSPTMQRQHDAARGLRLDEDLVGERSGHDRARARALAYHQAVARRLRKPMVIEARHVLYRWRTQGRIAKEYADRWDDLLRKPLPAIRLAIVEDSPAGDDLRQNSPLAGLLSEPERRRILHEVR